MRLDLSSPVILIAIAETLVWAAFFYTFPILLLHWEGDFGWAREDIALALTLALIVSAVASPLAGRLIDRGLSRLMFPAAATLGGGALLSLTLVETQAGFYAAWAFIGLACSACLYEPCFAFLTRVKQAEARGAITTTTLIAGFASTLCFPLADWLTAAYGWRAALTVFAAIAILAAAPLFAIAATMLERGHVSTPKTEADGKDAARAAFAKPAFWLLAAAFPILAVTHGMTISHLIPILGDRGASAGAAVFAASLIGPCQVLGRIVITAFAASRSAAAVTMIAFLSIAGAMACLFFAKGEAQVFIGVIVFGAGYGVLSITRPLVTADFLGRRGFGAISGALASPFIAGTALAPFVAALLWRAGGYDLTLAVGGAFAIAGAIFLWLAERAHRRSLSIAPGAGPR